MTEIYSLKDAAERTLAKKAGYITSKWVRFYSPKKEEKKDMIKTLIIDGVEYELGERKKESLIEITNICVDNNKDITVEYIYQNKVPPLKMGLIYINNCIHSFSLNNDAIELMKLIQQEPWAKIIKVLNENLYKID